MYANSNTMRYDLFLLKCLLLKVKQKQTNVGKVMEKETFKC